jgi:hypothetical protein
MGIYLNTDLGFNLIYGDSNTVFLKLEADYSNTLLVLFDDGSVFILNGKYLAVTRFFYD